MSDFTSQGYSPLGFSRRSYKGTAFLPEIAAADSLNLGAQAASRPTSGLGIAPPADTSAPVLPAAPDALSLPAPLATPAPQAQPQQQPAPQQQPLIDYHTNPMGAIGLVLGNMAAGIRGQPLPSDALARQKLEERRMQLEEQSMQFKSAEIAASVIERYAPILANTDEKDRPAVIAHAQKLFGPATGNVDLGPLAMSLAHYSDVKRQQVVAGLRSAGLSTGALGLVNAALTAGVDPDKLYEPFLKAAAEPKKTLVDIEAEHAAATRGDNSVQKAPEGWQWNPDKSLSVIPNGPADPKYLAAKAASQKVPGDDTFSTPITVEADDGQGGRDQFTAQQDKKTGQWVSGDQNHIPLNNVVLPGGVPGGGRAAAQISRVITAARDIKSDLQNAADLPVGSSSGFWAQLMGSTTGQSLSGATKNVLANKLSSQEVQDYNVAFVGLGKALGTLDAGGLQTSDSFIKQLEGLQLKEGDTGLTKLRKFASIRQQAENSLETLIKGPLLSRPQKQDATELRDALVAAIPWTPSDVTKLEQSKNPQATIRDLAKSQGLGVPSAAVPAIPAAAIQALKASPGRAADFDRKYGAGSAKQVLGR